MFTIFKHTLAVFAVIAVAAAPSACTRGSSPSAEEAAL